MSWDFQRPRTTPKTSVAFTGGLIFIPIQAHCELRCWIDNQTIPENNSNRNQDIATNGAGRILCVRFEHYQHGNGLLHDASDLNDTTFEIYPLPSDTRTADTTLRLGSPVDDLNKKVKKIKSFGVKMIEAPSSTEWVMSPSSKIPTVERLS